MLGFFYLAGAMLSALGLTAATLDPTTYAASAKPSAVTVSFYDGPLTRGFAWQTESSVTAGRVWLLAGTKGAADAAEFLSNGTVFTGTDTAVTNPSGICHKVAVTGLVAGTTYSYRLGAGDANDVYGTFTVKASPAEVTALYCSDAQTKDVTKLFMWENTVSNAVQTAGLANLDFVLFGGDLYDENATYYKNLAGASNASPYRYRMWGLAMDTATPYLAGVPWAFSSGNHDYTVYADATAVDRVASGGHSFDYGPVHVATLPYLGGWSDSYVAVCDWLHADLQAASNATWKIVAIHWGPYTSGDHYMDVAGTTNLIRKLAPICASNHVDLVFQAHDHVFTKTLPYRWDAAGYTKSATDASVVNLEPATVTVDGTVYDHDPNGTYYVCTGCAGHRVGENTAYAELSTSTHCYTNGTYKIATDTIDVDSSWAAKGDNASHDLSASMFGVLKATAKTLSYDFYVVATNGLAAPVLYDTLRIYKGDVEAATPKTCVYLNDSGVTDLTDSAAWSGGIVPGANDVAVFDGTISQTLQLGTTTAWAGIVRTNTMSVLTLQAPANGTLTLGEKGLNIYSDNQDFFRFYFNVDMVLGVDQTWTLCYGKTPALMRALQGPGRLQTALRGFPYSANLMVEGSVRTSVVAVSGLSIFVLGSGVFETAPTLAKGSNLLLVPGSTAGTWTFSDVFSTRAVANAGCFSFGAEDNNTSFSALTNTITLVPGDQLQGPNSSTSSRQEGHIRVQDAHVVSDGADVTGNVWFDLRSGSWTQKSGDTAFSYGAIVGRGMSKNYGLTDQRLALEGGTFTARRLVVGLGNGDSCPAEVFVNGGSYASTLATEKNAYWAGALALAPRSYSGESNTKEDGTSFVFSDSDWTSARLEISDGSVRTPAVLFGNDNNAWNLVDGHAGARVDLSGGRLEVGTGGLRTATCWNTDDSTDPSWYDVVLSGGTLAFFSSSSLASANMRLSNRHGGVAIEVPDTISDVAISGSLYGDGRLRKTGGGCLQLRGANDYTGRTEVVEGRLAYGNRFETAVWTGDGCGSLSNGAVVAGWSNCGAMSATDPWIFKGTSTIPNTSGTTEPTFAAGVLNGHGALAFGGSNAAFLTGNVAQPISDQKSFTVSVVVQTEPGFVGSASTNVSEATQIFGTSMYDANVTGREYGLAIDGNGHVGCGMFGGRWKDASGSLQTMDNENLWATNVVVNDGKPHVIAWTWTFAGNHSLRVDDQLYRQASISNGVSKTKLTRILLGVGERQMSPVIRFKGYLADLRMTSYAVPGARVDAMVRELGIRYGVEAFAGQKLWSDVAAASSVSVPEPTATWSADSLAQTAGQSVSEWTELSKKGPDSSSVWTFTSTLADAILKTLKNYPGQTTAPVVSAETLAGHKMVSFNGENACLALTGSKATPVGDLNGLTVAMVVRFNGYGQGGGMFTPATSSPFFGSAYGMDSNVLKENWQLMLSGSARVGVAHRYGATGVQTLRSRSRFLNDGAAHIVIARLPQKGTDDTLAMFIDGTKEASSFAASNVVNNTRILLGGSEYGGCHYAPVDVAEFRLWGGTVLSDDEVQAVGAELAATYGLDLPGATRGKAVGSQQMSKEVVVHAGAVFGALGDYEATLYPGQTLWGDGTTSGLITLAPGAAVKATTDSAFTFAYGATFMDGAALAAEFVSGETLRPVAVTGDLRLEGNVVVRLSVPGDVRPSGTLLTWTGNLVADATPTFTVVGVDASAVVVKLDTANKCIKVVPMGGLQIIIR